jgi:hypothetical protein
MIKREKEDKNA